MKKCIFAKGVVATAMCLAAVGCSDTDLYNPGLVQREAATKANNDYVTMFAQNVGTPNANQDWNLMTSRNVNVNVGGEASKDYTLYVCTANPALYKDAALLGTTTAKGGTTATVNVTTAASTQTVYVMRADEQQQFVAGARLNGDQYEASFSVEQTPATMRRRASAVVSGDPFTFENTSGYYKTTVPASAKTIQQILAECTRADWGGSIDYNQLQNYTDFELPDGTYSVHLWSGQHNFYVSGSATLNVDGANSINHARIYVLPNSTFNLNMDNFINNLEIYVSDGATLNYNAEKLYKQDGGGKIYIAPNATAHFLKSNFEINQNATVYNEGTMTANDVTSKPGDGNRSFFYNFGDLTLTGKMELNSCSNFYNTGTVNVTGTTSVTQANIYWINQGHYVTGPMVFSAKNNTFYNTCQLLVKGNAHMYDGEFNLMENGYIEAETADFDNFIVNMATNTGFNIKGDTDWGPQGDGTYQGFKATGTNAYVRLGGTTTVAGHLRSLEMTGNITYAINEIVDLGAGNSGVQPTYVLDNEGVVGAPFATSKLEPKDGDCGFTWGSGGGIVVPEMPVMYSIAFEDLGAIGDFDFNDVVLYVAHYVKDNKAKVYFMAAGGELDVDVKYDGTLLFSKTDGKITNTGKNGGPIIDSTEVSMTGVADLLKYSIYVKKTDTVSFTIGSASEKGKAPQALIIPGEWAWPIEQVNICDAYPGIENADGVTEHSFGTWVKGTNDNEWYNYPDLTKVVK